MLDMIKQQSNKFDFKALRSSYCIFATMFIFVISYIIFKYSFVVESNFHHVSDLPYHTKLILSSSDNGHFPVYSIWYILVYIFSGFSKNLNVLIVTSVVFLSILVVARFIVTYAILLTDTDSKSSKFWVFIVAFALIFVMPIISYYKPYLISPYHVYLGNIGPNQWCNSTFILSMPFNLLLFYFAVNKINSIKFIDNLVIVILAIISILCKPNFAIAFLPVFFVFILISNYKTHSFITNTVRCILIAIPCFLLLLFQWYFTFKLHGLFSGQTTIFAPFFVWRQYSPHIAISLLLSIAFPLSVLILFWDKMEKFLLISWCTFLVALLIMLLLSEYPNSSSANYFWGAYAGNYMLFLFSSKLLLKQKINWKSVISYILFCLHFVSGIFPLLSFFINKTSLLL